jgi:hypothetical protein
MEILLGFGIAMVVGMTGMGGGPLAAPLLMLVLGLPPAVAVGTSLLFVSVTKLAATTVYWRNQQIDWPSFRQLAKGGVPGVVAGTLLLDRLNGNAKLQPAVLAAIGALIAVMALLSFWRAIRSGAVEVAVERPHLLPWLALPIGLEVGFSSAGAGALTSIALLNTTKLAGRKVVGTDLVFGLLIAALGGGIHLTAGNANLDLLWKLSTGGVAGALCGAWMAGRLPAVALRIALNVVMAVLGQQLLWKGFVALNR